MGKSKVDPSEGKEGFRLFLMTGVLCRVEGGRSSDINLSSSVHSQTTIAPCARTHGSLVPFLSFATRLSALTTLTLNHAAGSSPSKGFLGPRAALAN